MGHWYGKDGKRIGQVPMASKPGEFRDPDLRDARKHGWMPGITTFATPFKGGGLDEWKMNMVLTTAMSTPREYAETVTEYTERLMSVSAGDARRAIAESITHPRRFLDDDATFSQRIYDDSRQSMGAAADFGTRVHDAIASYINGAVKPETELQPFVRAAQDEVETLGMSMIEGYTEFPASNNEIGYGCTIDWITRDKDGKRVFIDWKTQKVKGKFRVHKEWGVQLYGCALAYGDGFDWNHMRLINVLMDTSKDHGVPVVHTCHEWPSTDFCKLERKLRAYHTAWCEINDYFPAKWKEKQT